MCILPLHLNVAEDFLLILWSPNRYKVKGTKICPQSPRYPMSECFCISRNTVILFTSHWVSSSRNTAHFTDARHQAHLDKTALALVALTGRWIWAEDSVVSSRNAPETLERTPTLLFDRDWGSWPWLLSWLSFFFNKCSWLVWETKGYLVFAVVFLTPLILKVQFEDI